MRLLDANANRAREGLRVVEDYARFIRNDAILSESLKILRHDLAAALALPLAGAIVHRDTPGDVGTHISTAAEMIRPDLASVVTASCKRVSEALRAIEEYLKTIDPAAAAKIESIRYLFYGIEQRLALGFGPALKMARVRLYVLITEAQCRLPWLAAAEQALIGGADCLQLREKSLESGELLRRARKLVSLCRAHHALCIINDRPDIAILADADGVHVGQGDLPAREVRKIVGTDRIVGVSTHKIEQAQIALADGADYIGVGPVFRSATKPRDFIAGLDYAAQVARSISIPAVAIAGITLENLDQVIATGMRAVAVTAAVVGCENVAQAARDFKAKLSN